MDPELSYVTKPDGTVVAVQVPIADWMALLERLCDLEQQLRPKSALDKRLDAIVRDLVGDKKEVTLDDIGFLGTGRAISAAENLLISAHIATRKASKS